MAHITLPSSNDEAWITGGKFGMIVAADEDASDGHFSRYPSAEDTVCLQVGVFLHIRECGLIIAQIPFRDGRISKHSVIHDGPCGLKEMVGI